MQTDKKEGRFSLFFEYFVNARKKISKLERYIREDATANVTFSVEKEHLCTVEITIRGAGPLLRAQTQAPVGDLRGAVDAAVGYIERLIL